MMPVSRTVGRGSVDLNLKSALLIMVNFIIILSYYFSCTNLSNLKLVFSSINLLITSSVSSCLV